jgi:hypothetical protein
VSGGPGSGKSRALCEAAKFLLADPNTAALCISFNRLTSLEPGETVKSAITMRSLFDIFACDDTSVFHEFEALLESQVPPSLLTVGSALCIWIDEKRKAQPSLSSILICVDELNQWDTLEEVCLCCCGLTPWTALIMNRAACRSSQSLGEEP